MLKKLTLVTTAAVFTMTMGIANAAPAQTDPVELTSTEMDTINAGGWNNTVKIRVPTASINIANATAAAVAAGRTSSTRTQTNTLTTLGFSASASVSDSISLSSAPQLISYQ